MRNPMSKNKFLLSNLFLDGPEEILSIHSLRINQSGFGYQNLIPKLKLEGSVKRKQQQWYLDSACSRHMTGDKRSFLSLKNIKGGNVAFGNGNVVKFSELERLDQWILMQLRMYIMSMAYNIIY